MAVIHLLTGSYSSKEEQGIKLWKFDGSDGTITEAGGIEGFDRPSFIAVHPNGINFIASSEVGDGELAAYRLDIPDGKISEINRQKSNGDHPAHVCIDNTGNWVLSVNYSGANVNVYPIHEDGSIGELSDSVKHDGSGPNADRQDAAHPHSVFQIPGKNIFLVSDLGTDTIYAYELDYKTGKLDLKHSVPAKPGSGPRHLAFHPEKRFVYSLGELDSTLTVYEFGEDGTMEFLQTTSLLPAEFTGENTSAEVAVSKDGRYLYASNRGHDSIASFNIREDGTVRNLQLADTGGEGPRHFVLVPGGQWLIAANENSDSLTVLEIGESGRPEFNGSTMNTKAPVCIKIAE